MAAADGVQRLERPLALEVLHREHEAIDRLLGDLLAPARDPAHTRRMLDESLRQHMRVEEGVFYPALARLEMLESFIQRMRTQHQLIREALDLLATTQPGSAAFEDAARRLNELVDAHVQEEESRAFAYSAEHLGAELGALAIELEHRRECERGAFGVG
jgi:hemerythrin-like domain-containing protein